MNLPAQSKSPNSSENIEFGMSIASQVEDEKGKLNRISSSKDASKFLNEIDDLIIAVDPRMRILYSTPSCAKNLGYTQEELHRIGHVT